MADVSLFDLAERRLTWLDRRQTLLARNVANADTPGYVAHDLAPFSEKLALAEAAATPTRTSPLHLAGATSTTAASLAERPRARAPDGNAVQLDQELNRVADTDAAQELVGDLYHKYLGLYRIALGR